MQEFDGAILLHGPAARAASSHNAASDVWVVQLPFGDIFDPRMPSIEKHRQSIDRLDMNILELIKERIAHVRAIRFIKDAEKLPQDIPEREEEIMERLVVKAGKDISAGSVRAIWNTLIREGKLTARTDD